MFVYSVDSTVAITFKYVYKKCMKTMAIFSDVLVLFVDNFSVYYTIFRGSKTTIIIHSYRRKQEKSKVDGPKEK